MADRDADSLKGPGAGLRKSDETPSTGLGRAIQEAKPKPHILVIGFPKSGTTTLQRAFSKSGLKSVHWTHEGKPIGKLVYDGWYEMGDPFAHFEGVDAITQMDSCRFIWRKKRRVRTFWPNLDLPLLLEIRELHPNCKFILNYRDPAGTTSSISRWGNMQARLKAADCPGLPRGRGTKPELERWITTHVNAVRQVFGGSENFLDLDIAAPDAKGRLQAFLGRGLAWWGVANKNTARIE